MSSTLKCVKDFNAALKKRDDACDELRDVTDKLKEAIKLSLGRDMGPTDTVLIGDYVVTMNQYGILCSRMTHRISDAAS